jgi:transcriptional regulator with PAS, ATPase and Fis domain
VIELTIPPLRERIEDMELLTHHFIDKHSKDKIRKKISPEVVRKFKTHRWPGNIRELENVIQSILIMSQDEEIRLNDLPYWIKDGSKIATNPENGETLTCEKLKQSLKKFIYEQEQNYIRKVLRQNDGNFTKTANSLEISRTTLYKRLDRTIGLNYEKS